MKKLIILESPNKVKAIQEIVKKVDPKNAYTVVASAGHCLNLKKEGKYNLGIDLTTFTEEYETDPKKKDIISKIKKLIKDTDEVILATDGDLQGEYIAWTLFNAMKMPVKKTKRAIFMEITEKGVKEGLNNTRALDNSEIDAARSQRMLDRMIGFRTSAVARADQCKQSGRVQQCVLKWICDRENEITNFKPETYYEIKLPFTQKGTDLVAEFHGTQKKKMSSLKDKSIVDEVVKACDKTKKYTVNDIKKKTKNINSPLPFTTSSLQQAAISKYGWTADSVSKVSQALFEGKMIAGSTHGLITYIRTDSTRISDEFIETAKPYITDKYGQDYYSGPKASKKAPSVGGAHECIRPTDITVTPEQISQFLSPQEQKLYKLIYNRTVASLMSAAKYKETTVELENSDYIFTVSGKVVEFDGFQKVYSDDDKNNELPEFTVKDVITGKKLKVETKQTNPPARFNESSIIKHMEATDVGRPSTYANTIKILKDRGYVEIKTKQLIPTENGFKVTKMMSTYFPDIVDTGYTSELEKKIDKIANGEIKDYKEELKNFWEPFNKAVIAAAKEVKANRPAPTVIEGRVCPKCGAPLYLRTSKYGQFAGCSKYPRCKHTEPLDPNIKKKKDN